MDGAGKKLWVYDKDNNVWVPLQSDADGKVVVVMPTINLDDLGDVEVPAPEDQDFLCYDLANVQWINVPAADIAPFIASLINLDDLADVSVPSPEDNDFLYWDDGEQLWKCRALTYTDIPTTIKTCTITFIIDGGGSAITTGQKGHLEIPFACTIKRVTMLADQVGSIVVDIWRDIYGNFPPTNDVSITASAPPTISSAQKSQDDTLTDWETAIYQGDILAFNVDSCTTITRVTISLKVEKYCPEAG